jgi:Shikimate 5-dehydrogenase
MNSVDLIVNSTRLGTYPDTNQAPQLPYQFLNEQHLLFDLIYNPSETLFMKKGIEKGAQVCNGYQMLVYQAGKILGALESID